MWRPYLTVIAKKAAGAIHVLDRFHIMAKMNKALDEVRAQESRALVAKGYRTGNAREFRWLQLGQGYLARENRLGAEETRQPRQVA